MICALTLPILSGCQTAQKLANTQDRPPEEHAVRLTDESIVAAEASAPTVSNIEAVVQTDELDESATPAMAPQVETESVDEEDIGPSLPAAPKRELPSMTIRPVNHVEDAEKSDGGFVSIDGRTYEIQLVAPKPATDDSVNASHPATQRVIHFASDSQVIEPPAELTPIDESTVPGDAMIVPPNTTLINLPTALSMVGGDHPAVGFARWQVQEAYAQLDQAEALWLPSLQVGFSFHRHDGNYQASNGAIVDVNRNSFQYGFGAGATGAGTVPQPGLRAQFHLADAIFQPEIAQKTAWARGHAENATVNRQLRDVALAYLELLNTTQRLRIVEESRERIAAVSKLTSDFAEAGEGLQADADRLNTELMLIDGRIAEAKEAVDVASARLAHAMSADSNQRIIPMDTTIVPLNLVSLERDRSSLIHSGLSRRPELKEAQALVAAACERHQRETYAPFVPSVLLGLSTSGFGGGNGNALGNVDGRYDFDAMMTWEIRNLGFGERAARCQTAAQVQQAMYRRVRQMDDVAREIDEAFTQVQHRNQRMAITQPALRSAEDSFTRNLQRIRNHEGLPVEVLQSVQAMETARLAYADAVVEYNEAQFRLQWALGWPVTAPPE